LKEWDTEKVNPDDITTRGEDMDLSTDDLAFVGDKGDPTVGNKSEKSISRNENKGMSKEPN
jgi:hypothetical protein